MNARKETPQDIRERLKQEELKNNPSGAFHDGINRSILGDFGSLGWIGAGIIILLLVIGFLLYQL